MIARTVRMCAFAALAITLTPAGAVVPTPTTDVFGKEYTERVDKNDKGKPEPLRVLRWDGLGVVQDGRRFTAFPRANIDALDVDGLAYRADDLYMEVIQDRTPLVFALAGDKLYRYRMDTRNGKANGIWATAAQINAGGVSRVDDLDIFGSNDAPGDADRFSLVGDPGGLAIWSPPAVRGGENGFLVTTRQIGRAIGLADKYLPMLDVDAFMYWTRGNVRTPRPTDSDKRPIEGKGKLGIDDSEPGDFGSPDGGVPPEGVADPADPALANAPRADRPRLLFSVAPITDGENVILDGGEIWEWDMTDRNASAAKFLSHGGVTWSTSFEVAKTICGNNAAACSEDIVALEAVGVSVAVIPEPSTWALLLAGLMICAAATQRRLRV